LTLWTIAARLVPVDSEAIRQFKADGFLKLADAVPADDAGWHQDG
jgi:hypothetical protein